VPLLASQMRTVPSHPALASFAPRGQNVTAYTAPLCSAISIDFTGNSRFSQFTPLRSHTFTLPSDPPLASCLPSGLYESEWTVPRWRSSTSGIWCAQSQILTVELRLPVARNLPQGLNAAVLVAIDSGNENSGWSVCRFQNVTAESSEAVIRYFLS